MSSLSWIVFDEVERQRARRIMALFEEKESRDELGLGPIRDSIADHLFPGTSTIQTRLRYMLFVPWIYTMAEETGASTERLMEATRAREIGLIHALRSGGEEEESSGGLPANACSVCPVQSIGTVSGVGVSGSLRVHKRHTLLRFPVGVITDIQPDQRTRTQEATVVIT